MTDSGPPQEPTVDSGALAEAVRVALRNATAVTSDPQAEKTALVALDSLLAYIKQLEGEHAEARHLLERWLDIDLRLSARVEHLEGEQVVLRGALEFYAARHRYHSECCGNCINNDGGSVARIALAPLFARDSDA